MEVSESADALDHDIINEVYFRLTSPLLQFYFFPFFSQRDRLKITASSMNALINLSLKPGAVASVNETQLLEYVHN